MTSFPHMKLSKWVRLKLGTVKIKFCFIGFIKGWKWVKMRLGQKFGVRADFGTVCPKISKPGNVTCRL